MNERIKELYITAMREDCGEKWDTQEEFIERFAELIVRECCQKLENDGMVEVAMELKEHFGIKK